MLSWANKDIYMNNLIFSTNSNPVSYNYYFFLYI